MLFVKGFSILGRNRVPYCFLLTGLWTFIWVDHKCSAAMKSAQMFLIAQGPSEYFEVKSEKASVVK